MNRKTAEDIQNREKCDKEFINKLSHLLDEFKISLKYRDIKEAKTSLNLKTAKKRAAGLTFTVILNVAQVYPDYNNNEIKRTFKTSDIALPLNASILPENFKLNTLKRTNLILNVNNNYRSNTSVIKVKLDINFMQNQSKKKYLKVEKFSSFSIFIGSCLALLSSISCGFSFVAKKWSLLHMEKGKNYYFDKKWWIGHSLMIIGDLLHFTAFFFAPAIIICTLQILTVIISAVASSKILGEKLHKYGKLAFALSLGGCWVIIFHVPDEPHVYSIETFLYLISTQSFLIYTAILSIIIVLLTSYWIPKYGKINSLPYTIQSGIFGSIIVIGLKGTILGYTDTISHWLPWTSFLVVSVFLMLQLECFNKALAMYNTLVVSTQYYVIYSAFVILASFLLFNVWEISSLEIIFTNFCGLYSIALGALILTIFEEENATFDFSRLFAGPERRVYK